VVEPGVLDGDGSTVHRLAVDPLSCFAASPAATMSSPAVSPADAVGTLPVCEVRLLAPCQPGKIVGVGRNYRQHAAELGHPLPAEPLIFLKPPTALAGPGDPIVRPRGFARVDFEGELAVVIGRRARHLRPDEALDHVFGYTCINDVSVRDLQQRDGQWTRAKGFDSFAPLGPCIATDLDPGNLRIRTLQNGVLRQDGSTADLIFDVPTLVAFVSRVMTLLPGDVIATGTPAGVSGMAAGDVVEIDIEGIGRLCNPVVDENTPDEKASDENRRDDREPGGNAPDARAPDQRARS
jgi:2-keto-4-pentenoate hydratase/2-oxohepta-3-ene-1,7-dioic acid hydratase in catechol pathway